METVNNNMTNSPEKGSGVGKWIVGGALGALVIANGFLFHRVNTLQTDLSNQNATVQTQFTQLRETTASSAASVNRGFEDLAAQLQEGNKSASAAAQRAATNAQKNAERLVAQLREQQEAAEAKFSEEIVAVKSVNEEQSAKVNGLETGVASVNQNVGQVKEEVAATKSTLEQTIADLKTARGDLGVQSGLIATNAKELAALKEFGEKNYYEFTINKKTPGRVGTMTIELKKADVKKNKYNIQILADDKRVEKKDRTINEPVQLYVSGARQPYEIVVNEVKKDTIVGYVAVPKVLRAAR